MRFIAILVTTFFLTSCATIDRWHQEWIVEHCVKDVAYNQGMTDGLTPNVQPDYAYQSNCPPGIYTAYLKGYTEGAKSRPREITINENITKNKV